MQDWIINSALIISSEICLDFLSGLSNTVEEIKEAYCLLVVESILRTRVKPTWIQPHIATERKSIRTSAEELKILPLIQKGPTKLLSHISNNCSQGAWLYSTVPVPISIHILEDLYWRNAARTWRPWSSFALQALSDDKGMHAIW